MKKYDDVNVAVWISTAIMTYNSYIECIKNNNINIEKFYFTQSQITKASKYRCINKVDNARVSQWYNGDHREHTYNYLKSKGSLRRISYIGEFQGEKEYPKNLNLDEKLETINGEKSVEEILNFLRNEYKNIVENYEKHKLLEILDFLKLYSYKSYKNPGDEDDKIKKKELLEIKSKGKNALILFKDMCLSLEGDNYKNKISSKWLNGANTSVRDYLWSEIRNKDKTHLPSSISIVAGRTDKDAEFKIYLEIRRENALSTDYIRHNKFLDILDIDNEDMEYFGFTDDNRDLRKLDKNEIKLYIEQNLDRASSNIKIGKSISYDFVKNNDSRVVLEIMKSTVEELKKYYEEATKEGEIREVSLDINKNTILYGPPGTGKTYNVAYKALEIIDYEKYKPLIEDKSKREEAMKQFNRIKEEGLIEFCTFHQSYSYEDFVEGLRSDGNGGFEPKDGIFKQICKRASLRPNKKLSKYDFDENSITMHKMSLGDTSSKDDEVIYDYCIKNNCVSLGYGMDIDYSNCKNKDEIKRELLKKDSTLKDNDFNITAVNKFKNIIKQGDIVIISSGNLKIRAIAKITGDYYYDSNTEIPYNHFRNVEWLYYGDLIEVGEILKDKRLSQATIYTFNNDDLRLDNIKSLISYTSEEGKSKNYVLIIDEINRGNISKIFGELITLIEDDKRIGGKNELSAILPYSNENFGVPDNLYIIGTMNTADRSIALLDTALRRRFEFIEYMPNEGLLPSDVDGIDVSTMLKTINDRIEFLFDRDHKIGQAYFIKDNLTFDDIVSIMKNKVIPLLQEYFYDDWEKIELILGGSSNKERDDYLLNKSVIKASNLFKGNQISMYPDQVKYTVANNPTKDAFIRIYEDIETDSTDIASTANEE